MEKRHPFHPYNAQEHESSWKKRFNILKRKSRRAKQKVQKEVLPTGILRENDTTKEIKNTILHHHCLRAPICHFTPNLITEGFYNFFFLHFTSNKSLFHNNFGLDLP